MLNNFLGSTIEDAFDALAAALPDYSEVLGNIKDIMTNLNYNLSGNGPLVYQLAALNNALGEDGVLGDIVEALGEDGIAGVLGEIFDQLGEMGSQDYSEYFEQIVDALGALDAIAEAFGDDGAIAQLVDALEGIEQELGPNGAIAGQLADLVEGIVGEGGTNDILAEIAAALADEDSGLPAIVEALGDNSEALQQIVEALTGDPDDPDDNGLIGVIEELKDILGDQGETLDDIVELLEELIELIQNMIPEKVYEYVELAPNFTWCTMNVGADKVTESGDYFAWAETAPKDLYSPDNYIWGDDQDRYPRGEHNYPLLSEDDAATVNWGAKYRTPTRAEWVALRNTDNFTWTYVESYKGSGVEGYTVTSKVSGYEGKMIFLPLTGYYDENGFHNDSWMGDSGSAPFKAGTYWSASGSAWGRNARQKMAVSNIVWHDGDEHPYMMGPDKNYRGYVVRAVYDAGEFECPAEEPQGPFTPENPSGYDDNGNGYVEMGDGLKWAIQNVGATSVTDQGYWLSWGETAHKDRHTWETYTLRDMNHPDQYSSVTGLNCYSINKYTWADGMVDGSKDYWWYDGESFVGDKGDGVEYTSFASYNYEDDAARVNMGGSWRTPTKAELEAFLDDTKYEITYTADYKDSGVKGFIIKSLVDGYTGNYIFFPCGIPGSLFTNYTGDDEYGIALWSSETKAANNVGMNAFASSVHISSESAWCFENDFASEEDFYFCTAQETRIWPAHIRGVLE